MFRGFATINFYADDLAAVRDWYAELLGQEAYFAFPPAPAPPAYIEFRVGDDADELGFIDRKYAPPGTAEPSGAVMHWHVDDLDGTLEKLQAMGATLHQPRIDRTQGFANASVVDPFGNVLGVMYNPHWKAMADGEATA